MKKPNVRGGLDTSVLIRLLTGDPAPQATVAAQFVKETVAAGQVLMVSNVVLMEAYFACQHHYQMPKKDVLTALASLLSHTVFHIKPSILEVLDTPNLQSAKPGFVDRIIHCEYSDQVTALITFEKSAKRLPDTEVLS